MKLNFLIGVVAACLSVSFASADLMWDEATDGDLSGDYQNPTQLYTLGVNNQVIFTTIGADDNNDDQDREYFTFTVAEGYELTALVFDHFTTSPETNLGFIGVAKGNTFPISPDASDPANLLGYGLIGLSDVGNDILQLIGQGAGAQGFSGALSAGTYSWWAQETGPSTDNWDLNVIIKAVPEPSAFLLVVQYVSCFLLARRTSVV